MYVMLNSACLFTLYWFKVNEKSDAKRWNRAAVDLTVIEVTVSTPMLLTLDLAAEIRII